MYFGDNPFLTLNIKTIRSCSLLLRSVGNLAFFNKFSYVNTLSLKTALKTEFARAPGRGDTCHLSNLDETLPD